MSRARDFAEILRGVTKFFGGWKFGGAAKIKMKKKNFGLGIELICIFRKVPLVFL